MSGLSVQTPDPSLNPLDTVEEIVRANEWSHDRASDEEMVVEIVGRWCDYRLLFVWQEEISALHFSCGMDLEIPSDRYAGIYELLAVINEKLWLGHFDLCAETGYPMFRHAALLRGTPGASTEQIEDLVEIAVNECERFYPAFQIMIGGSVTAESAIDAAIIEPLGEA